MRIKTIEQLYDFCDDIFISSSRVAIVKFDCGNRIVMNEYINDLTRLSQDLYIMKVLESAFKEHNVLELTFGASFNDFTIVLHMDLCY